MNHTVIVYQSKYGATKKYADWIAQELGCDIFERKHIKIEDLMSYHTIIYGGGLYAGGVSGIDLVTKNFEKLNHKNLILFTCGLADPKDTQNIISIRQSLNKVLTNQMQEKIEIFHFRGAMDYSKLNMVHKAMMAMVYKLAAKKDPDTLRAEDKEMIATYGKIVDFTEKNKIDPLINYVKKL